MSFTLTAVGRAATAAVMVAAGLVVATPAQAATLTVDVTCEALGRYRVLCERTITGGLGPYKTRWSYNGNYFPAFDDKAFVNISCTLAGPNQYQALVADANGAIVSDTSGIGCRSGLP